MLLTLARYRMIALRNALKSVQRESRLKIGVLLVTGFLFWSGLFALLLYGFGAIGEQAGYFKSTLYHYVLSLFFLALVVMLIFSNTLISFSTLFKSGETSFLFATPVPHHTIYLYKLGESIVFSSWAVFALGIPVLLAMGIRMQAEWPFYPLALAVMIPFVILPAGIGGGLGLLLTAYVPRHRGKLLIVAVAATLVVLGYVVLNVFGTRYDSNVNSLYDKVLGKLSFARNYMMPSYWTAEGLLSVSEGNPDSPRICGIFFGAVVSSALCAVTTGWFISGNLYARAFSDSHSLGSRSKKGSGGIVETLFYPLTALNPQVGVLLIKDAKNFLRDPVQWSQVSIFFGILLIYSANLRNMSFPVHLPFYKNLTTFLNLSAASMTLATICSRFIFPMVSLEGQRFWILGLAPLSRSEVMLSKFYFAFGGTAALSIPLVILSNTILESSPLVFAIQLWLALLIPLSLSGMSVGLGALFPNFRERNPSKIVSGFGGTLTLILSITLVISSVGGAGFMCHRFIVVPQYDTAAWRPASDAVWVLPFMALVTALNVAAAWVPMKLGLRALEKVEF